MLTMEERIEYILLSAAIISPSILANRGISFDDALHRLNELAYKELLYHESQQESLTINPVTL